MMSIDRFSVGTLVFAGFLAAGCQNLDEISHDGAEEDVAEAVGALQCESLPWPFQGCLSITPTGDQSFVIQGDNLGDGTTYFSVAEVCYKKKGAWQSCWGSGLSSVQGTSPVLFPANGDFSWETPSLYANETYRVRVRAVLYNETYEIHDGYHSTQPVGNTPLPPMPPCDCWSVCGETGGVCTYQGCACY